MINEEPKLNVGIVEHAFGVVGQNDGVARGDFLREQRLGLRGANQVGLWRRFPIDAAKLLALHHHPRLHDGLAVAGRAERGNFFVMQGRGELAAGFVLPEITGDGAARAERSEVERDVASATGGPRFAIDVDDGHGRLGRNARGVAPDVAIEHDVANHQHAGPR